MPLTSHKFARDGKVASEQSKVAPVFRIATMHRLLRVAALAAAMFFSSYLQGEPFGLQSAPLWLRYPNISPDGKTIAFSFEGHLFLVPSAGGIAQPITAGPAHDTAPVWSPDSKLIAFASDRYGHYNVFLTNAEGGRARRLTSYS